MVYATHVIFSNGRQPLSGAINEFTSRESRSINKTLCDNDYRVRLEFLAATYT